MSVLAKIYVGSEQLAAKPSTRSLGPMNGGFVGGQRKEVVWDHGGTLRMPLGVGSVETFCKVSDCSTRICREEDADRARGQWIGCSWSI